MTVCMVGLVEEVTRRLTDVNTGSYIADGYGEDYFDDPRNLDAVIRNIEDYCIKLDNGRITYDQFLDIFKNIDVEWETSPMKGFNSFKADSEKLSEACYDIEEIVNEYIVR